MAVSRPSGDAAQVFGAFLKVDLASFGVGISYNSESLVQA
jgi:hypothetical protein